jgi:hypothetical protein
MPERKRTPDILGDLLQGKPAAPAAGGGEEAPAEAVTPAGADTSKPVHHNTGIPANQQTVKQPRKPAAKPRVKRPQPAAATAQSPKTKATYYLATEAVDALEDAWHELRKLASGDARGRIAKSLIVEQALLGALADLQANGKDSELARRLLG